MSVGATIDEVEGLVIIAVIVAAGFLIYKFSDALSGNEDSSSGTPAGAAAEIGRAIGVNTSSETGGRQCTYTDMENGTCIDTDGAACSWLSFLTGYTCYQGRPGVLKSPLGLAPAPGH